MTDLPRTIGRYDVERLLGQGGMGRVFLARDTILKRRVAIKTLRDDLALPPRVRDELVERMRHEAEAAAAVSHPSIVTLYDMGEDDVVGLYLVFEYVPGPSTDRGEPESLRDRLKKGPLPLAEVARLARELGSALTFAHEAGVIHRDVKPENILFSRTGAKIADFGIARIPESTLTRANTVLGTPAYTAPEALSKGAFGPASDQFSLAATLYEAATAARAFGGDDPIATAGRVSSEPPPPMHDSIASEVVLRPLEAAIQRGLAKEPAHRFGSCAELGEAVARSIEAPVRDVVEIERTPLSSRSALTEKILISERSSTYPPGSETPRPSIIIRQRTHRAQNIAAAVALLVIIVLVLLGRRQPVDDAARDAKDAAAPAVPHTTAQLPRPKAKAAGVTGSGTPATTSPVSAAQAEAPSEVADVDVAVEAERDE